MTHPRLLLLQHKKLYGRHIFLQTNHEPHFKVLDSINGNPAYTANRLQRRALTFLVHKLDIKRVAMTNFGYADLQQPFDHTQDDYG